MTCRNSRDTITQDAGVVLGNHFDYPDSEHLVTSFCRTSDGTWIAWLNQLVGDSLDDGTGDPNKGDWPSRVASAYAVSVGFFPDDGSGPVVYDLAVDPIFTWKTIPVGRGESACGYWTIVGDLYELYGKAELRSWAMNPLDVQVRTDGTNVWVAVLAQEAVKYPYLYNNPLEIDRCGRTHPTFEDLWAGGHDDPFFHDWDVSSYFWLYGANILHTGPFLFGAYDDPGADNSFRWQPARVTVFAGDIGGFTRLDTVEAKFDNMRGDSGLLGGLEAAASPAEPGVLHLLWAEGGNFGSSSVAPMRGQRINYSQWSSSSKSLDTDLRYEDASGHAVAHADPQLLYLPDDQFVFTAEMILRNDHGSPIAIVWPWVCDDGPQSPTTTPEFWDLSTGAAEILQTLDEALVPTAGELLADPVPDGGLFNAQFGPPHRSQFASSLYVDPTLEDQHVYLICASYSAALGAAFYRIPCDGSAPFDFMDGTRKAGYTIIRNGVFLADFVSDPDNVWMPTQGIGGGYVFHLTRRCIPGWELVPAFPIPDPSLGYETGLWGGPYSSTSPPAILTDADGDWVAGGGVVMPTASPFPTMVASLKAKICRCCVPCAVRGVHLWKRI